MAKRFLFLAVGALALTACTSSDVTEDIASTRNAIRFENVVSKPTRGDVTEMDINSLTLFNVYGFYTMPTEPTHAHAVFKRVPVSKSTGSWSYASEYERFWVPGATYYFYAYSCNNSDVDENFGRFNVDMETGNKAASERTLEIKGYQCDTGHQHDLVFAKYSCEAGTTNGPVAFQFNHILSKVKARFTNSFSGEYDIVIKKVTIDDICNVGDYSFQTGWQDVDRKDGQKPFVYLLNAMGQNAPDASITIASKYKPNPSDDDNLYGDTFDAVVIPNDYTSLSAEKVYLNVTIDVMYGNDVIIPSKTLKATLNPKWEEGCSYIYNIDLSAAAIHMNKIEFDVEEIKGWGNYQTVPGSID